MREQEFEDRLAESLEAGPTAAPDAPVLAAIAYARAHPRGSHPWSRMGLARGVADLVAPAPTLRVAPHLRLVPQAGLAWALIVAGLVLALAAAAIIGSRLPLVVEMPANGLLAFSYDGDIYTLGLDGTARDITAGSIETETSPAWSADGRLLAFRVETVVEPRRFGIDVVDLQTMARREVSSDAIASQGRLAFSPDGRYLAFGQGPGTLPSLTIASVDGSAPARVLTGLAGMSPSFSPDGSRIAFVGRTADAAQTDIYVEDVASLHATRLTSHERLGLGWVGAPSWSDGGRSIVFEVAQVDPSGTLSRHVYSIRADGTGLRQLGPPAGWQEANGFDAGPVVSPRGDRVAFQGDGTLKVLDVRTGALVGPAMNADMRLGAGGIAWAPDGTAVAVLHWRTCANAATSDRICPAGIDVVPIGSVSAPKALWTPPPTEGVASSPSFGWELAWQPVPRLAGGTP